MATQRTSLAFSRNNDSNKDEIIESMKNKINNLRSQILAYQKAYVKTMEGFNTPYDFRLKFPEAPAKDCVELSRLMDKAREDVKREWS